MKKFFRKLQHFRTFNFSFLFRKCSRKLCAKNEKSQEKRILATLYPLPISSSLSLFFFLINHPQKKSQKSGKVHAPKKKISGIIPISNPQTIPTTANSFFAKSRLNPIREPRFPRKMYRETHGLCTPAYTDTHLRVG